MSNPVPSALTLNTIVNGTTADATPVQSNFAETQVAVNQLITCLSGGSIGQLLSAVDGTDVQWAAGPGSEIGYDQITSVVNVTGTTSGTATTIIAGSAYTFDGAPVIAEIFSPFVTPPDTASGSLDVVLFESSSAIAVVAVYINQSSAASASIVPLLTRLRFTPSAGSHTYSVKAFVSSTTGTPSIGAGVGSAGASSPAYLRFTKV